MTAGIGQTAGDLQRDMAEAKNGANKICLSDEANNAMTETMAIKEKVKTLKSNHIPLNTSAAVSQDASKSPIP